jgi:alanine racemase
MMAEPQYRSWVEVELDNFTSNLNEVRRLVGPRVKILQVVKADAYGHGAIEISHVALQSGASALGVANADEGVQLRVGGISAPIIILSPSTSQDIQEIIKYNLIPSVSDLDFARNLQDKYHQAGRQANIHIEVDTGMGRGGTIYQHSLAMIQEIMGFPNVNIEGIFTHLAQSETTTAYNDDQWRQFQELLRELQKHNISIPQRHIANSGAILNYPDFHLDMVRPGLMTYGIHPSPETTTKARLAPVMSFKTRVLLIKDFPANAGIGYGSTFVTSQPTKIATIPVGYGDGYGLPLSNQGEVLIRGKRVPVVGRVSMDMSTLDVGNIPGVQIGDEVVMLGRQGEEEITADELAAKTGTISYEIICALGKRAPRVFLQKGKADAVEPRLKRIFIPDEEKSVSRLDNVIRRCLRTRVNDAEFGDAIYYAMLETLFGKEDRQLELRSNFRYDIRLQEFSADEVAADPTCRKYFKVVTKVAYRKTLTTDIFMIGCAENNEQLAALLNDPRCEYRWLLNSDDELQAARDFRIQRVRIDDADVPLFKTEMTVRGCETWCGGENLVEKTGREVKVEIEIITKKSRENRDFSVYLIYPIRGLDITFNWQGTNLANVREIPFFAGKHPYPTLIRGRDSINLRVHENDWVFPTSGVTFCWDY